MSRVPREIYFYTGTLADLQSQLQEDQRALLFSEPAYNNNMCYVVVEGTDTKFNIVPVSEKIVNGVQEYCSNDMGKLTIHDLIEIEAGIKDFEMTTALPISEDGNRVPAAGFTTTSIIGMLNELLAGQGGASTLQDLESVLAEGNTSPLGMTLGGIMTANGIKDDSLVGTSTRNIGVDAAGQLVIFHQSQSKMPVVEVNAETEAVDNTVYLVDTTADDVFIKLPVPLEVGFTVYAIKISPDSNGVYITTEGEAVPINGSGGVLVTTQYDGLMCFGASLEYTANTIGVGGTSAPTWQEVMTAGNVSNVTAIIRDGVEETLVTKSGLHIEKTDDGSFADAHLSGGDLVLDSFRHIFNAQRVVAADGAVTELDIASQNALGDKGLTSLEQVDSKYRRGINVKTSVNLEVGKYIFVGSIGAVATMDIFGGGGSAFYSPAFKLMAINVWNNVRYEFGYTQYQASDDPQYDKLIFTSTGTIGSGAPINVYFRIGHVDSDHSLDLLDFGAVYTDARSTGDVKLMATVVDSIVGTTILEVDITSKNFRSTNMAPPTTVVDHDGTLVGEGNPASPLKYNLEYVGGGSNQAEYNVDADTYQKFLAYTTTNVPTTNDAFVMTFKVDTTSNMFQIALRPSSNIIESDKGIYVRSSGDNGATWGSWKEVATAGSGALWHNDANGNFTPITDHEHTLIGTMPTEAFGKFEVHMPSPPSGGYAVTGGASGYDGTYTEIDSLHYELDATHHLVDTGWYWVMCSDANDAWNTAVAYGAGGKTTPDDVVAYTGTNGHSETPLVAPSTPQAVEAGTFYGKLYASEVIKSSKGFNISNEITLGKASDGYYTFLLDGVEPRIMRFRNDDTTKSVLVKNDSIAIVGPDGVGTLFHTGARFEYGSSYVTITATTGTPGFTVSNGTETRTFLLKDGVFNAEGLILEDTTKDNVELSLKGTRYTRIKLGDDDTYILAYSDQQTGPFESTTVIKAKKGITLSIDGGDLEFLGNGTVNLPLPRTLESSGDNSSRGSSDAQTLVSYGGLNTKQALTIVEGTDVTIDGNFAYYNSSIVTISVFITLASQRSAGAVLFSVDTSLKPFTTQYVVICNADGTFGGSGRLEDSGEMKNSVVLEAGAYTIQVSYAR